MNSNNPILLGLVLLFSISIPNNLWSQSQKIKANIAISNGLSEKYKDESIAIIDANDEYTFFVEKDELQVRELIDNEYIGIKENVRYSFVQFYDEKSYIKSIEVRNDKGKKSRQIPQDRKYESQDYFHTDSRVKYIFITPGKGMYADVKSEKIVTDAKYFTKAIFQESIPIVKKKVKFIVPKDVEVEFKEFNFEGFDIKKGISTDAKSGVKIYTYTVKDLDPIPDESNSPGSSHFLPHILVLPKSYPTENGIKNIFKDTKDMYSWYRSLVQSLDNKPVELESTVTQLLDGIDDEEEKIKTLYYWVQDNIRYIAFEDGIAGFKPDECQNVFNKKFGDCKGMANLLKEMLIIAGFDARLTWIGTDHLPYDYSTPSLAVDNHMICTLFWNGKKYYLDPTEKYNALGYNAARIQGKEAMIEDGDDFILDIVPEFNDAVNREWLIWDDLKIEDDKLIGKGNIVFSGEKLSGVLYQFNNMDASNRQEAIERLVKGKDKNFIISELEHSDPDDRDNDFEIKYDIELDNMVTSFDNSLFLDLDYYKEFGMSKLEDRKTDYLFRYKFNIKNKLSLQIPVGYVVEEIPAGIDIENEYYKIKTNISNENGFVKYEKLIALKKRKIPIEAFEQWNDSFKKLGDFYQEQVVLSKK